METRLRAPHFVRVTQALAFVSGLGTCAVVLGTVIEGCAAEATCTGICGLSEVDAGEGDALQHDSQPVLVLDASDASHAAPEDSGLADVLSPPRDAGTPDVHVFNGVAPPPDLDGGDAALPK